MAYNLKVQDMSCGGCAASIRKAVERVPGVEAVSADPNTKDVVVKTAGDVSLETIVAAIKDAGYSEISTQ
jgi:Copper chaperone